MINARIGGLLAALLLCFPAAAHAATYTVNSTTDHTADACDSECTLRDAVTAANSNPGADTIVVPAGTYSVFSGSLPLSSDLTISGPAGDTPTAIVNVNYSNRAFDMSGGTVTIGHLTIHGGSSPDSTGGSGVVQRAGVLTLDHDVFDAQVDNLFGGALALLNGTLTITDTEIDDGTAYGGGGLYMDNGTATIDRTLFYANGHNTGGGGAIYHDGGAMTVTNSTFVSNQINAGHGGAIYQGSGSLSVTNSTFEGNVASGNNGGGGAIWADAAATITNDIFGPDGYGDNCAGGGQLINGGGNVDTGSTCAAGVSNAQVQLGPLANTGGATRSLLPYPGSAGIDGGTATGCPLVDQRGVARSDGHCDAGAVEGVAAAPAPAPSIAIAAPELVDAGTVAIHANIDRYGITTNLTVESGTDTSYGTTDGPFGAVFGTDNGPQDNGDTLYNLDGGATYHYRVSATSAGGTTVSPDQTIQLSGAPYVKTGSASDVAVHDATLNAQVNPAGQDTTYHFDYGPTTAYGSSTADADAGDGIGGVAVKSGVSGLAEASTVHYRVVATNPTATIVGDDETLTTANAIPAPPPAPGPLPQASPTAAPTATPTPAPAPTFEKTVVAKPVSGTVLVKLPGAKTFTLLSAATAFPTGTQIDTRKGKIELTRVTKTGQLQTADFYDGIFTIGQTAATTDLTLSEALAACPKTGKASAAAKKPKTRKLWGSGSGAFRTRGKYSAATVRGTTWLTQDSCAGTLTHVTRGVVAVRDNVKHKTVLVKAGKSYLARPR